MDEAKLEVMRNIAIAHCSSNADHCIQINGSLCTMHSLQRKCTFWSPPLRLTCRQALTGQCEELREAALREGLFRHGDQTSRPVRAYPQLDKLSTAWKLSLPGFTNGLSSPVFKEVMAQHLCLPSPACQPILGQPIVTRRGGVVGPFADELMTAHLTEDSWRHRHDSFKVMLVNMCNEARVPIDCEVYGIFRDLIPAALTGGWRAAVRPETCRPLSRFSSAPPHSGRSA